MLIAPDSQKKLFWDFVILLATTYSVIEVPVSYGSRMGGESKHSDTFRRQAKLAFKMFRTICRKRFLERGAPIPRDHLATETD